MAVKKVACLINHRLVEANLAAVGRNQEISVAGDARACGMRYCGVTAAIGCHIQRDRAGIGAGSDNKIIFQLLLIAVVDEVYAGIRVLISDL